ncbi:MAG: glycosyltransferase family 9 protein [Aldersonia sp.]|nr:glycosyltransferase family 9 protein [Aldersonia sp.]
MTGRVLVARLDSAGDVLITGPAVRAVAQQADSVVFLAGPRGRAAAELLPGVDEILEYRAPWVDLEPPELTADGIDALIKQIRDQKIDRALIFTSFHQSPLPLALVLRMAGVPWIGAISEDYPGALLDVRHRVEGDPPEPERALSLATACGFELPADDPGGLQVRRPLPDTAHLTGSDPYVVVHPGAAVPARRMTIERSRALVQSLIDAGRRVVVTGGPDDSDITLAIDGVVDLCGATSFDELAGVLSSASVAVVPNTGPAHLAAAVGTPIVSLFAPVVPVARWAPYGVRTVVLGDQRAPCAMTRARTCPVPERHCLDAIGDDEVLRAIEELEGAR